MANIIIELSKYIIIILIAVYTFSCFSVFLKESEEEEKSVIFRQKVLLFAIQFTAYLVMFLKTGEGKLLLFYLAQVIMLFALMTLYTLIYPTVSRLIVNNMCMLICIGWIMITRLSYTSAVKQFIFVILGSVFSLIVPVIRPVPRCFLRCLLLSH